MEEGEERNFHRVVRLLQVALSELFFVVSYSGWYEKRCCVAGGVPEGTTFGCGD